MQLKGEQIMFADTRIDGDVKKVLRHAVREFSPTPFTPIHPSSRRTPHLLRSFHTYLSQV